MPPPQQLHHLLQAQFLDMSVEPVTKKLKGWCISAFAEEQIEEGSKCPNGLSLMCAVCKKYKPDQVNKYWIISDVAFWWRLFGKYLRSAFHKENIERKDAAEAADKCRKEAEAATERPIRPIFKKSQLSMMTFAKVTGFSKTSPSPLTPSAMLLPQNKCRGGLLQKHFNEKIVQDGLVLYMQYFLYSPEKTKELGWYVGRIDSSNVATNLSEECKVEAKAVM